ncbi:kinesin-like protein KIF25 [Callospermophilus lateralis]|uniref:kinesin-like protein KIF25 n=1 Tax=Callospermophilus lateralis TaxID=76772 RepID=UPI0040549669
MAQAEPAVQKDRAGGQRDGHIGAVASAAELVALVHGGLQLRARHPTLVHMASSRSHLVVTVTLTVVSPQTALPLPVDHTGSARQAQAKLQLVDLAGSECAGASGVTGLALRETSFINRSLAALADVLGALSERRGHVPYRNSKLTHLLQDTIGGDAKLLVILCVSPGQKHVAETLQGLGFGARARQAERGQAGKRPSCAQQPGKKRRRSGRAVPVGEREPKPRLPPPRLWVLCREGRPRALSPGTLAVPGSRGRWLGARLTP